MLHAYGGQPAEPRLITISSALQLFFFFFKGGGLEDDEGGGEDSAETPQGAVAVGLRRIYIAEHNSVVRKSRDRQKCSSATIVETMAATSLASTQRPKDIATQTMHIGFFNQPVKRRYAGF